MSPEEIKRLAHELKPVVNIGKGGVTENLLDNIIKNLKANKVTKVKILGNILDAGSEKNDIIDQILEATKAELVEKKGNTVVLYKR